MEYHHSDPTQTIISHCWNLETNEIDLTRHSTFIIRHILREGRSASICWLRQVYTEAQIAQAMQDSYTVSNNNYSDNNNQLFEYESDKNDTEFLYPCLV